MFRPWLLLLTLALHLPFLVAQLDTLIGLQGEDFVLLAADPVLSRSLTLLHSHHDKLPPLGSHHCLALGGPVYFAEIISEVLGAEKRLFEKRLRRPLSTRAVAAMARNLFLEYKGLPVRMLVAGWEEVGTGTGAMMEEEGGPTWERAGGGGEEEEGGTDAEGERECRQKKGRPCLYWLDSLGALQKLPYAAHGEASVFLTGLLDQQYHQLEDEEGRRGGEKRLPSMEEAVGILDSCYQEMEKRFLVNAGGGFEVKIIDSKGVRRLNVPPGAGRGRGHKQKCDERGFGQGKAGERLPHTRVSGPMGKT